jgi:hypothetical protein
MTVSKIICSISLCDQPLVHLPTHALQANIRDHAPSGLINISASNYRITTTLYIGFRVRASGRNLELMVIQQALPDSTQVIDEIHPVTAITDSRPVCASSGVSGA